MNQPKYVKGKDGKFQGSIGGGKTAPTSRPAKPTVSTPRGEETLTEQEKQVALYLRLATLTDKEKLDLAKDETQPGRVLAQLVKQNQNNNPVMCAVAGNPKTPPTVLSQIVETVDLDDEPWGEWDWDNDYETPLRKVVTNRNCPPEVLADVLGKVILWDEEQNDDWGEYSTTVGFWTRVVAHPNAATAMLGDALTYSQGRQMHQEDWDFTAIPWSVMNNPNCDDATFVKVAMDSLFASRRTVDSLIGNTNISSEPIRQFLLHVQQNT